MTKPTDRRGILACRLAMLPEPHEGEDPALSAKRAELEAQIAAVAAEDAPPARLPYADD